MLQKALLITERPGREKQVNSDKVETLLLITCLGNLPLERGTEGKGAILRAVFPFEHAMTCDSREVLMAALLS